MKPSVPSPRFCLITPPSPSGIAVIRLAGRGAEGLLSRLFRPGRTGKEGLPGKDRARYGFMVHGRRLLDEVLVMGHSPKEEWDICCHGGEGAVTAIFDALETEGAEAIPLGRWVPEATLAGDFARALSRSRGPDQALILATLEAGALRNRFDRFRERLSRYRVRGEEMDESLLNEGLRLVQSFKRGRFLNHPPRIVIRGPANVGKSTLFNALLGDRRALTSRVPGTTRDPVEALLLLGGFPIRLFDLPGTELGEPDAIRDEAFRLAERILRDADLTLDLTAPDVPNGTPTSLLGARLVTRDVPSISVINKSDLHTVSVHTGDGEDHVSISALREQGLGPLIYRIERVLGLDLLRTENAPVLFNRKQHALIAGAIRCLNHRLRDDEATTRLRIWFDRYLAG